MEMPATPFALPAAARAAAVRAQWRQFLARQIGSEGRVAEFLIRRLQPALRLTGACDEMLVAAWLLKAYRRAMTEYTSSPLTPEDRARVWLACGSATPGDDRMAINVCVAHVIDAMPEISRGVLRQVEFGGASLWMAGFNLELNAHAVWARPRNGRAECRERLIQFQHDCAAEAAREADDQIAAIA